MFFVLLRDKTKEIEKYVIRLVTRQDEKHLALFLYRALILFTNRTPSTIGDPSSMWDACHMNFVIDLAHRRVCGSMTEHRWSEVRFLVGTQNFFFVLRL